MASQAFKNAVNYGSKDVTAQSLLNEIKALYDDSYSSQTMAGNLPTGIGFDVDGYRKYNNSAIQAAHQATQLKNLLNLVNSTGGMSGSSTGSGWSNPFGGGSGASGGGASGSAGAPQFSNSDNRFAAGLSDAEARLRSLLDDPDSIKQSAAYKFRVKQGEDALQRNLGARGLLNSGNRLMELTKYGQDMGSQEYDAQYGRLGNLLSNYSQGYTADKNANVNLYGAKATAFNQAQANQNNLTTNNQKIWSERTPVPIPGFNNGFRWV